MNTHSASSKSFHHQSDWEHNNLTNRLAILRTARILFRLFQSHSFNFLLLCCCCILPTSKHSTHKNLFYFCLVLCQWSLPNKNNDSVYIRLRSSTKRKKAQCDTYSAVKLDILYSGGAGELDFCRWQIVTNWNKVEKKAKTQRARERERETFLTSYISFIKLAEPNIRKRITYIMTRLFYFTK